MEEINFWKDYILPVVLVLSGGLIKYIFDLFSTNKKLKIEKNNIFQTKYFEYEIDKTKKALFHLEEISKVYIEMQELKYTFSAKSTGRFEELKNKFKESMFFLKINYQYDLSKEQDNLLGDLFDLHKSSIPLSDPFRNSKKMDEILKSEIDTNDDKELTNYNHYLSLEKFDQNIKKISENQSITTLSTHFNNRLKKLSEQI